MSSSRPDRTIWLHPPYYSEPFMSSVGKCILQELCHDHTPPVTEGSDNVMIPSLSSSHPCLEVHLQTTMDRVILTRFANTNQDPRIMDGETQLVRLAHPPSCPAYAASSKSIPPRSDTFMTLTKKSSTSIGSPNNIQKTTLPASPVLSRHSPNEIQLASTALLISSDQKVLLTQRSPHLRTFPNFWVVPGGKVDPEDLTLEAAAIREVHEETGIDLTICCSSNNNINNNNNKQDAISLLCLWESCYPIHVKDGPIRRQHLIAYYCISLKYTSHEMEQYISLENDTEVSQLAWIGIRYLEHMCLPYVEEVTKIYRQTDRKQKDPIHHLPRHHVIESMKWNKDQKSLVKGRIPCSDITNLLAKGTEYAISEWVRIYKNNRNLDQA